MILEVMEVKWRSKRGRIDTAMAYSKNMGKNRVVCKKDPQSVENCDREPPPTLKVPQVERPLSDLRSDGRAHGLCIRAVHPLG